MDDGFEFEVKILMSNNIGRYGGWGVCFTYAAWFALSGLAAVGKTYSNCKTVRKGVDFLLSKQKANGGWGESYLSCPDMVILILTQCHCLENMSWSFYCSIQSSLYRCMYT